MSCGCGRPKAAHADSRNITILDLRSAATAAGIDPHKAATNILTTLASMHTHDHLAKDLPDVACQVLKTQEERRYSLGLAYPAFRPDVGKAADGFRDFVSERTLEESAWSYMQKSLRVGLDHSAGRTTEGHATVVESYIYRGPDWHIKSADGDEKVIKAGDWLLGLTWDESGWADIKNRRRNGLSPQGKAARRTPSPESLARLRRN